MASHRVERVQSTIRQEVAIALERDIKDPRLGMITVSSVKVTSDLRMVKVYYTVLGDEEARSKTAEALLSASGFIRRLIGERVRMRYLPEIKFEFDDRVEEMRRLGQLFGKIDRERKNDKK